MSKEFKQAVSFIFVLALFFWVFFQASSCIDRISRHEALRAKQQQEQRVTQDIPSLKVADNK